jgi:integrase
LHWSGNEVGEQIGSIKTAWRATCRRARIRGLHFHDLRREFGSRLLESGAAQHDVRDFLGHANITTTSRYLKSTPLRLERALAAMDAGFALDSHKSENSTEQVTTESTSLPDAKTLIQ